MPKEKKSIRILVAGIGGVGGFFGGKLAHTFENHPCIQIVFLVRSKHGEVIKEKGLRLLDMKEEFICHPCEVVEKHEEIEPVDYVLICTKSYDLQQACEQIKPFITNETVILPLLNGVNNTEKVEAVLPNNMVLHGCVYLVSSVKEAGYVHKSAPIQQLHLGLPGRTDEKVQTLYNLLKMAGINAFEGPDIEARLWKKYIFLAAIASVTAYYDSSLGPIMGDVEKKGVTEQLVREVIDLAYEKGVSLEEGIFEETMSLFHSLPAEITSSMHRDFQKDPSKTELESLCGYVVEEGRRLKVDVGTYDMIYQELVEKG